MREEHKKIILFAVLVTPVFALFGFLIISYIQPSDEVLSCNTVGVEGFCIDVEFKTSMDKLEGNDVSEFSFPQYLRQGDFLWIDKITIIKKPPIFSKRENKIKGDTLKFNILPTGGHLEELYPSNYGEFDSKIEREIDIGDKYVIKKMENGEYQHLFNGKMVSTERHWKIELYRTGEWYIDFDIEGGNTGWSTLFNGKWHGDVFNVYPRHEIENIRTSDKSLVISIIALLVIIYIFIIDYYTKWVLRDIDKKEDKSDNVARILNEINSNLLKLNSNKRLSKWLKRKKK